VLCVWLAALGGKQPAILPNGIKPAQHHLARTANERHAQIDRVGVACVLRECHRHRPPPAGGLFAQVLGPHAQDLAATGASPQVQGERVTPQRVHVFASPCQQGVNVLQPQQLARRPLVLAAHNLAFALEAPAHHIAPPVGRSVGQRAGVVAVAPGGGQQRPQARRRGWVLLARI